jgi:hypothetical protein
MLSLRNGGRSRAFYVSLRIAFFENMRDVSKLRLLCSSFCTQYQSDAKFYIDEPPNSEIRHLVVVYEKGGYGGARNSRRAFPRLGQMRMSSI